MANVATNPTYQAPGQMGATPDSTNPHNAQDGAQMLAMWDYLRTNRWNMDLEAYMNDNYYRGEHYLVYNLSENRLDIVPFSQLGNRYTTVNRVREKVTQAVSFLTREEVRFDVQPASGREADNMTPEEKDRIHAERNWADYQYKVNEIDTKMQSIALSGAKFSLGWWMTGYDPTKKVVMDDGSEVYGDVWIEDASWWRVYTDPLAKTLSTQRFMAEASPVTMGELRRKYKNASLIQPDEKASPSMYEEKIRKQQFSGIVGGPTYSIGDELSTAIRVRLWYWKWVPDTGGEQDPEDTGNKMKKELWECHITTDGLILKDEKHVFGDWFPFEEFRWDAPGGTIQGEGMVKQIRLPNKALNILVNSTLAYADTFKGKILEPRASNVQVINDEHGERVMYDADGGEPKYWAVPPISPTVQTAIQYLEEKIDDLALIHPQFGGGQGFSGESGYHAEVVSSGDANNFAITKNNLQNSMARIFKKALIIASQEYKKQGVTRSLPAKSGSAEDRNLIAGEDINVDDDITVTTQHGFAHTKQYIIDKTLEAFQLGLIPAAKALEALEYTDLDQVLMQREEETQGLAQGDSDAAVAELENRAIASGQNPPGPQPGFDANVHRQIHMAYLKSPEAANNDTVKGKIMALLDFEANIAQQQGGLPGDVVNQNPQGAPASMPPQGPIASPGSTSAPQPMPPQLPGAPVAPA